MSPLREAFVLPCLFLTVVLLGGLRISQPVRLLPPSLVSLVLAMLLLGALVRSKALVPERLMNQRRTAVENLSGLVVLLTLFAASAQVFNLVTPDTGLLHLLVSVFFLVQLLTTLAAARDRLPMLRSLVVLLGCAFILRFLALESLYSPGRGLLKRVMTALMEGVTFGGLAYEPAGAATGYVAFLALTLYVIGLVMVGAESEGSEHGGLPVRYENGEGLRVLLVFLFLLTAACHNHDENTAGTAEAKSSTAPSLRDAALAAARVWRPPAVPVASARLGDNPPGPGGFQATDEVSCRFVLEQVRGTTAKFNCELPNGEILKVKYGRSNPELYAEVAATRLLAALGFGADRMYVVAKVRCFGCPAFPFTALRCYTETGLKRACFAGGLDYSRASEFDPAVVERRMDGRTIEALEDQGWAWHELDRIDPAHGGASPSEVDGLRLMAVILAHWDNKAENQRLICVPGGDRPDGSCATVLALMQDLGATFGPTKLDLPNWQRTPVWEDARACRVSMERLPFGGATFPEKQISEEGRRLVLELLQQLSEPQLGELFTASRITMFDGLSAEGRDAGAWVRAFQDKVRQVREAGPCPAAAALTSRLALPSTSSPSDLPSR